MPVVSPVTSQRPEAATKAAPVVVDRTPAPQSGDAPETWSAAICAASDKALALSWLSQLKDETALAEVALRARSGETRFAAVQRIDSATLLERVAQGCRDKDKRVYRHCADLLKQRRQAEASAQRAREISDELQRLLAAAPLPNTRLLELNKTLGSLPDAGEAGLACGVLMQQALAQLHRESEVQRDLHAQFKVVTDLAGECRQVEWPWSAALADWRNRFEPIRLAFADQPSWLSEQSVAKKLSALLTETETRLAELTADAARGLACEQFLAECEAAEPPEGDRAAAWAALEQPLDPALRGARAARWQALNVTLPVVAPPVSAVPVAAVPDCTSPVGSDEPHEAEDASEPDAESLPAARAAKPAPRPARKVDQDALGKRLDALEQAIAQGHLVDADVAAKQIKQCLGGASLHGALESRLHDLQAQLETLRGWARWGTEQARQKLIEAAQELLVGEREAEALAKDITGLRDEWKRLNVHAAASKAQWEGFDALLEQAYVPVAAYRAEQAERQAQARIAREAMCTGWEGELAGMDWSQADFKAVEAWRAEWIKQWRAAPQAGFRDERALRKRFDTLIGAIDQQLDAAREAEFQRREALIVAAEALTAQNDLRLAMNEAKALQQRWTQQGGAVRLKRGDDQKQWQRFRAACNTVFERLDVQRAELTAQRQEQEQARQRLLDAFAAQLDASDAETLKRGLGEFRTAWSAARPAARDASDNLEKRAQTLQQQAQQRLDRIRQDKSRARFTVLAQKALLAQRVEAAGCSGVMLEAVLAEAKQAWDELERLPGPIEQAIAHRFTEAHLATEVELEAGRAQRESLLLDLEISLGLPSPEHVAEVRRERQLSRLQNRFGAVGEPDLDPEALLLRCYAIPSTADAALDQRLSAAVQALMQHAEQPAG